MDNPYGIKLVITYGFTFLTAKCWKHKMLLKDKWECMRQYSWLVEEAPPTQDCSKIDKPSSL